MCVVKTLGYRCRHRVIPPLQVSVIGAGRISASAQRCIYRDQKPIGSRIPWVEADDCLKGNSGLLDLADRIERLAKLSLHFAVARILARKAGKNLDRVPRLALASQNNGFIQTAARVPGVESEGLVQESGGFFKLVALGPVALGLQLGDGGANKRRGIARVKRGCAVECVRCRSVLCLLEQPYSIVVPADRLLPALCGVSGA